MINLKSKLLNLAAIARILNVRPGTLYNRVHGVGRHAPLTSAELNKIEQIVITEIYK